jgi:sterol desaturase/sphingolipid hydroxylase (fatty acid hydroxylase superfamily)
MSQAVRSEEIRRKLVARIPRWYVPWVHLLGPSLVGVPIVAYAVARVRAPRAWELATVPLVLVLSNFLEWLLHRDVLHHSRFPFGFVFVRHTPQHHGAFDGSGLAIREAKELKLVLLPAFGVLAMFLGAIAPALAIAALVSANVGALWVATTVGYVLAYEWFHLSYHLPEDSLVGRLPLVRVLRRHHAAHHTPELMQRANFNVTVPLWDWLLGTMAPAAGAGAVTAQRSDPR